MKQQFKQRLAALVLALCVTVCSALPALAADVVDTSRTGSVSITLYDHHNDVPLRGGRLTLYKVADVVRRGGSMSYVYTGDFKGCTVALGDLSDSDLAAKLEAYLPAAAAGITRTISEQGKARFADLAVGVYLVKQTEASHGYDAINSFVVSVPLRDGSSWLYDVDATPKVGAVIPDNTPDQPGDTDDTPDTPTPIVPVVPTPDTDKPTTPDVPDEPAEPDIPDLPMTPDDSDDPVSPGTPDQPVEPGSPDNPVTPGNPDNPVVPARPDNDRLPQTGQLNWPIPVLACSGMLLFAIGWTLNRKEGAA